MGRSSGVAAEVIDRLHVGALAHRLGAGAGPAEPTRGDTREVAQLLADPSFDDALGALSGELNRDSHAVRTEAAGYLRELSARHANSVGKAWAGLGRWMLRAYELVIDDDEVAKLRKLDADHSLIFLPSHRSYLDAWAVPLALGSRGLSPSFGFIGANLNFFPFGLIASRAGTIFIRRNTKDMPVYRSALRSFIGQLIRNRENLGWAIEGGRTRTGKLRAPMYGILRYVTDAVEGVDGPEVLIVPVSVVYDQLHEVSMMTSELRGGAKRPENIGWLVDFARQQRHRLGRAYVDFGEPIYLRHRLDELRADDAIRVTERIAVDVCHRIDRATPVTVTSVVCLALLAADRALSLDEMQSTVRPLAKYLTRKGWPVAGGAELTDRSTVQRTLRELVDSGVLSVYAGGTDTVWNIRVEQHLVAAFYRNTALHTLIDRAIGEVALVAAAHSSEPPRQTARAEALRLRELLKFDFFFSARETFEAEMREELRLLEADDIAGGLTAPADATRLLCDTDLRLAHLVLRPFLEAYQVVADRLTHWGESVVDDARFLDDCLRVGRQWVLQGRLSNAESLSLELFKNGLQLARHRSLVEGSGPTITQKRREFQDELRIVIDRIDTIAALTPTTKPPT